MRLVINLLLGLLFIFAFEARADVITDWNAAMLSAFRIETSPPPLAARNLAILHISIFDAVNCAGNSRSFIVTNKPQGKISAEAAVVAAGFKAAVGLYPGQRAKFEALRDLQFEKMDHGGEFGAGIAWGEAVAEQVLEWRRADGAATQVPYIPSKAAGQWQRTPPYFRPPEAPHWAKLKTFALESPNQFRPPGPPPLTSSNYVSDFETTRLFGGKQGSKRTEEQTEIARFWSDFSYTSTPPGHWNEIAAQALQSRPHTLLESARLFALLNVALADTAIAVWDTKYAYNSWRPVTAIREAASDGNPRTESDQSWESLLPTPAFPEYVSGHSAFSAAAAEILAAFFGTDKVHFEIGSDSLAGTTRTYESFRAATEEIGMSRIYGGIHFPSANRDGQELGKRVALYILQKHLELVSSNGTPK